MLSSVRLAGLLLCFAGATPQSPPADLQDLLRAGQEAVLTGRPKDALALFGQALVAAERGTDDAALAQTLEGFGWGQWATGAYAEALKTRTRALDLFVKLGDAEREAALRRGLGETHFSMGRFDAALEQYGFALEANARAPKVLQHGLILANMGSAYRSLGRFADAQRVLDEAYPLVRSTGDHGAIAQVQMFRGMVARAVGAYDRSLEYYAESIVERRAANDRRGEAQVLGNLANVHLDIGEYERAVELNAQSLAIATEVGYRAQVGFAYLNTGAALSNLGRAQEALASYEQSLVIWREIGRRPQLGWALHNVAILRIFQTKDYVRAQAELEEAFLIAREVRTPELESYVLRGLANLDLARGQISGALERFDAALALARDAGPELEYLVLTDRAEALRRAKRPQPAVADLREAVAIVSDLRANVGSDQSRIAFMDSVQDVFHSLADLLFDLGRHDEALEIAEASRARAFADLLMQRQVHGRASVPGAVAELRAAVAAASDSRTSSPKGADRVETVLTRMRADQPQLASAVTALSPRVDDMRRVAARLDATVVEYLVTGRRVTAWVIQPTGAIHARVLPITMRDLTALGRLRTQIEGTYRLADGADTHRQLKALHRALVLPIAKWLPASSERHVVIVPHGPLALVPFAALEDAAGAPLIDRHTLAYVPSLAVSSFLPRSGGARGTGALIVADPPPPAGARLPRLPASREEGDRVARHLRELNATVLAGPAATESVVKKRAASARVLHFATHGVVSESAPLTSSLVLAAGDGEDGFLRVDEVLWLDLQADLVVLSGCSTGSGKLSGDGILGLSRAFLFAGTPSLVVTQWDIADAPTMVLMDKFYAALRRGASKARALREAQLATRSEFPHPAYWASFVLIGEP